MSFTPSDAEIPGLHQHEDRIDESYRAQAPKRLVSAGFAAVNPSPCRGEGKLAAGERG